MPARYRCPFCGSFNRKTSTETRKHILQRHRMLLIEGLGLIETFSTRKDPNAPPRRLKDHLQSNMDPGDGDQEEGR